MQQAQPFQLAELILPHSRRVLFHGPPSTGKSYLSHRGGLRTNQRMYSITLEEGMSSADLLGCWMLKDRDMSWHHGVGIQAWLDDARLVIDEIDHASVEARSFLHRLLDDPEFAQIKLPSGDVVRPGPNFQVVATMNGDPMQDLPEALRSRFPVIIHMKDPNPEAIQALPSDLRRLAERTACHVDEDRRITLRVWYEYAKLRAIVGRDVAAQACFQHRAEEVLDSLQMADGEAEGAPPAGDAEMSAGAFIEEYERLCREGKKIQAIQLRRKRYGEGLREAKDKVDAYCEILRTMDDEAAGEYEAEEERVESAPESDADWVDFDLLIHAGCTNRAAKLYRKRYGVGYETSKEAIDARSAHLSSEAEV